MHQTIAGESHAIHVPLDENLLVGIALSRKSVEARSMLVWGEHCTGCVMPSCYACCAFYAPRQATPAFRSRHRASSSGEVLGMRASFRKGGKLEAEGRLSAVSLQRSQALTIDGRSLRWNAVSRSPERRSGSRRSGQQVHAFSIPYGPERDAPPDHGRYPRCRARGRFLVHARSDALRRVSAPWHRVSFHAESPSPPLPRSFKAMLVGR